MNAHKKTRVHRATSKKRKNTNQIKSLMDWIKAGTMAAKLLQLIISITKGL